MPIHHAVLSLLEDGPSYGYELKANFEHTIGPQWGPLNIGHLYQILERLQRDGLVDSRRDPQPSRPDRVVYEITPAGRAELAAWLTQPVRRTGGYRDDLFLKIMAAARSGDREALPGVLEAQRTYLLGELRDLGGVGRSQGHDQIVQLLLTAAELQVGAQLQFIEAAEDQLLANRPTSRRRPTTKASEDTKPGDQARHAG